MTREELKHGLFVCAWDHSGIIENPKTLLIPLLAFLAGKVKAEEPKKKYRHFARKVLRGVLEIELVIQTCLQNTVQGLEEKKLKLQL